MSMEREVLGTVARVVRVLQALADANADVSIKELSDRLQLPPSTVHRLLGLLLEDGIVEKSTIPHLYRPGLELIRIGSLVAAKAPLSRIALPFMEAIVRTCDEVCMLVLYLPSTRRVMVVHSVDSSNPLRYQVDRYVTHSPAWGATGRSVLAFLPECDIDAILAEREPSPATGQPLPPPATIRADLAAIRERGYALTQGQKIDGAVGMGAPIFGPEPTPLGALCITIPKVRYKPNAEAALSELLLRQTNLLNQTLGHPERRAVAPPRLSAL